MTAEEFDSVFRQTIDEIRETLIAKGKEYSRNGDRLWNFKVAALKRNTTPESALRGMTVKHTVSIDDMVNALSNPNKELPSYEFLKEKINDEIDYLILLKALFIERAMIAKGMMKEDTQ